MLVTQFPNIFRIIPERKFIDKILKSKLLFYISSSLMITACLVFALVIIILGIFLYKNSVLLVVNTNQRHQLQNRINFWQSIAQKYKGYKDAYFQIAVLEYQLGDVRNAKQENSRALLLDPNFNDAKKLENLLNKLN